MAKRIYRDSTLVTLAYGQATEARANAKKARQVLDEHRTILPSALERDLRAYLDKVVTFTTGTRMALDPLEQSPDKD